MSKVDYKYDCTFCQTAVESGAPPEMIFYLEKFGTSVEPIQQNACPKCVKIIKEHNDPIEQQLEKQDRDDAAKQPPLPPSTRGPKTKAETQPAGNDMASALMALANGLNALAVGQEKILQRLAANVPPPPAKKSRAKKNEN